MSEPLTRRTMEFTRAGLARLVKDKATLYVQGVALWIEPRTGEIVLLDAASKLAKSLMDASCGTRDGIVSAYVGRYMAPTNFYSILEDIEAHDRGLQWRMAA